MQRDLIGYGKNVPQIEWPGGGRIAENIMYFVRTLRAAGLPVGPACRPCHDFFFAGPAGLAVS